MARVDGDFLSLARRGRKTYDPDVWPFIRSRLLDEDDPRWPGVLADFRGGDLIAPSLRAKLEPWRISGTLRRDPNGPPIVGELTVEHFPLDAKSVRAEVTGTVMRRLRLADMRDDACAGLEGHKLFAEVGWHVTPEQREQAVGAAEETKRKRGRPGYPPEHYERIALRYLELLAQGKRNVLKELANEESERLKRIVPRETVRDWVRKATKEGYLAPGKPGRADARPGPKLTRKEK